MLSSHETIQSISYWGVFAAGFTTRPIGAVIFGHIADTTSRKTALIASILTMALPTVAIGCLPTFNSIGVAAPIILAILRAVQGLAMGGEFGSAVSAQFPVVLFLYEAHKINQS